MSRSQEYARSLVGLQVHVGLQLRVSVRVIGRRALAGAAIAAAVLSIVDGAAPRTANAQLGIDGHPELTWRRIETRHFEIVYHQGLDSLALEAARAAEACYAPITIELQARPRGRTRIFVTDHEDVVNGFANPLGRTIVVWARGEPKLTSAETPWLARVIAHEFVHIVTFEALHSWIGPLSMGLHAPPRWFLEGLARYLAEAWEPQMAMVVRNATLADRLSFGGSEDLVDGLLLYEEGHARVRYLTARFGRGAPARILAWSRRLGPRKALLEFGASPFPEAFRRATGVSLGTFLEDWRREMRLDAFTTLAQKEVLTDSLPRVPVPIAVPLGVRAQPGTSGGRAEVYAVSGLEDLSRPGRDLWRVDVDRDGRRKAERLARSGIDGFFDWSPDGKSLVFARIGRGAHGSWRKDLYVINADGGRQRRLTHDARAADPTWSPDGRQIVYVVHERGGSHLVSVAPDGSESRSLPLPRDIVSVWSPRFGSVGEIVFSLVDSAGVRGLGVVRADGSGFQRLSREDHRFPITDRTRERSALAFTTMEDGIPNLEALVIEGGPATRPDAPARLTLARLSDVATGIYTSDLVRDTVLALAAKERDSVLVLRVPLKRRAEFRPVPERRSPGPDWKTFRLLPGTLFRRAPEPEILARGSYSSLAALAPRFALPVVWSDDEGVLVGALGVLFDPQLEHLLALGYAHGLASGEPAWGGFYSNHSFRPRVGVSGFRVPGAFRELDDETVWERRTGGGLRIDWSFPSHADNDLERRLAVEAIRQDVRVLNPEDFPVAGAGAGPGGGPSSTSSSAGFERPKDYALLEAAIQLAIGTSRPDFFGSIHPRSGSRAALRVARAFSGPRGALDYTQGELDARTHVNLGPGSPVLALRAVARARDGDQAPQEIFGLDDSDPVWQSGASPRRVRGIRRVVRGDRMLLGTVELRFHRERSPMALALFTDIGTAWFEHSSSIDRSRFLRGSGAELAYRLGSDYAIRAGIGFEWKEDARRDLYVRLGPVF